MGAPVIGLLGVIIGGVLASALAASQEHRGRRLRARTAARLLLERFEIAASALEIAQELASDLSSRSEPAVVFANDFETPEWSEARSIFAEQLDGEAFAELSRVIASMRRLREYGVRFQTLDPDPEFLLKTDDLEMWANQVGRNSSLLSVLSEIDLRSLPIRIWQTWRRPRKLTDLALDRYLGEGFRPADAAD